MDDRDWYKREMFEQWRIDNKVVIVTELLLDIWWKCWKAGFDAALESS